MSRRDLLGSSISMDIFMKENLPLKSNLMGGVFRSLGSLILFWSAGTKIIKDMEIGCPSKLVI